MKTPRTVYCELPQKGTVNLLSMHPKIATFDACALSRHTTETTVDSYLDMTNPLKGLLAANTLHGCDDFHTRMVLPGLKVVGNYNIPQVEKPIKEMFHINIADFQRGWRLHVVLSQCAATLIIHTTQIQKDCNGISNRVSTIKKNLF